MPTLRQQIICGTWFLGPPTEASVVVKYQAQPGQPLTWRLEELRANGSEWHKVTMAEVSDDGGQVSFVISPGVEAMVAPGKPLAEIEINDCYLEWSY